MPRLIWVIAGAHMPFWWLCHEEAHFFVFLRWCIDRVPLCEWNLCFCIENYIGRGGGLSAVWLLWTPGGYSTDRSKAMVLCVFVVFTAGHVMLSLAFPFVLLFIQSCLALWLPRLGKRRPIHMLLVHLFILHALISLPFLFLMVSGFGYGLWFWHSLGFSVIFVFLPLTECRTSPYLTVRSIAWLLFIRLFMKLADMQDMHKVSDEFKFWPCCHIPCAQSYFPLRGEKAHI